MIPEDNSKAVPPYAHGRGHPCVQATFADKIGLLLPPEGEQVANLVYYLLCVCSLPPLEKRKAPSI